MKIGMISLGCPKNLVDSEVMLGLAQQAGHRAHPRRRRRRRARRQHLRLHRQGEAGVDRHHPRDGRAQEDRRLPARWSSPAAWRSAIATSCATQIPEIDAVLGTGEVPEIVEAIGGSGLRAPGSGTSFRCSRSNGEPIASGAAPEPVDRHRRRPADLHLRRRDAAAAGHAAALRLREDCRGLRLQVRLLHHPDAARQVPQPAGRVDRRARPKRWRRAASRSCCSSRRTRASTASIAASAARWRACSARSTASTGSSGSACSTSTRRRSATTCSTRWPRARRSASTSTCRCSTPRTPS